MDEEDQWVISLELVDNGSVLDLINTWKMVPEVKCRRLFCQLIAALQYLHCDRQIVHRDIKSENILLDSSMNIRLIDFGFANVFDNENPLLKTTCGSPFYMAPEVIKNEPYTAAADIWSAGVVLYTMLVGHLPFQSDNVGLLLQSIVSADPVIPAQVSSDARSLLTGLLKKDPKSRMTIPRILAHPWLADFREGQIVFGDGGVPPELKVHSGPLDEETIAHLENMEIFCYRLPEELKKKVDSPCVVAYKMLRRQKIQGILRSVYIAGRGEKRSSSIGSLPEAPGPLPAISPKSQDPVRAKPTTGRLAIGGRFPTGPTATLAAPKQGRRVRACSMRKLQQPALKPEADPQKSPRLESRATTTPASWLVPL